MKKSKGPVFETNEMIKLNLKFTSQNIRLNLFPDKSHKKQDISETPEEIKFKEQVKKER